MVAFRGYGESDAHMSQASTPYGQGISLPESTEEFEAMLAERTDLTDASRAQLDTLLIGDLRNEARQLSQRLQALAQTIALSVENPESLRTLFVELEPTAISREHNWRHIFAALKAEARTSTDLSRFRSVLIKYMQFLSSRKHLLDDLIERKTGLEETDVHTNVETYLALQARMRRKEREGDDGTPGPEEFVRLAVGNTITLRTPPAGELEILLAGHQFKLVVTGRIYLRDLAGVDYELLPGRNVIGRHPDCEVVLPGDLRNISRAHLLIERADENRLNLTDLSSKGTFLPADLLVSEI